jgi:hypothetical protein
MTLLDPATTTATIIARYKLARKRLTAFPPEPRPAQPRPAQPKGRVIYNAPCGPKFISPQAEREKQGDAPPTVTFPLRAIVLAVAAATGVSANDITSVRRQSATVKARNVYYYAARKLTNKSFPEIGRYCGGKDHSTVMHGISRVEQFMEIYAPVIADVERRLDKLAGVCKSE